MGIVEVRTKKPEGVGKTDNGITPETLIDIEAIPRSASLVSTNVLLPWTRMGAESFLRATSVKFKVEGHDYQKDIAQQAILSSTGCKEAAKTRYERLESLNNAGAPTPTLYGLRGADIFTDYIHGCKDPKQGIKLINSNSYPSELRIDLISQLSRIAAALDAKGFTPGVPFFNDLLFNGKSFFVIDTGFDLGGPNSSSPVHNSYRALTSEIHPSLNSTIEEQYFKHRETIEK